jgi:hypothetical protein
MVISTPLISDTVHVLKFSEPNVSKTDSSSDRFTQRGKKFEFLLNVRMGALARKRSKVAL